MANETSLLKLIADTLPTHDNPLLDPTKALVPLTPLEELALKIQNAHSEAIKGLSDHANNAIVAGEALLQAKALLKKEVGHGAWEDYVAVECRLTIRTAQNYMRLAKKKDELTHLVGPKTKANSFLTQTQALKLLTAEKKKPKAKPKAKV